jgi:hypothetical protein
MGENGQKEEPAFSSKAVDDSFLPERPDYEDSGRKFWVYPPGKPLPA